MLQRLVGGIGSLPGGLPGGLPAGLGSAPRPPFLGLHRPIPLNVGEKKDDLSDDDDKGDDDERRRKKKTRTVFSRSQVKRI